MDERQATRAHLILLKEKAKVQKMKAEAGLEPDGDEVAILEELNQISAALHEAYMPITAALAIQMKREAVAATNRKGSI